MDPSRIYRPVHSHVSSLPLYPHFRSQQPIDQRKSGQSRGFLFLGRPPTYGKTTLSRPNSFQEQDDIEGIHLRLCEVDGTIPWIPVVCANVFRSSVQHCIIEFRISKDRWVVGPTQPTGNDSRGKASKARLSDGRRRPPVARRDRRDKAETILWRWFLSGPVIIVVEVERDLEYLFFGLPGIIS